MNSLGTTEICFYPLPPASNLRDPIWFRKISTSEGFGPVSGFLPSGGLVQVQSHVFSRAGSKHDWEAQALLAEKGSNVFDPNGPALEYSIDSQAGLHITGKLQNERLSITPLPQTPALLAMIRYRLDSQHPTTSELKNQPN